MPKINAVLLDLDGTLRDTKDIIYDSIQYALKVYTGRNFSRQDMDPYIHHHLEVYKGLVGEEGLEVFDKIYSAELHKHLLTARLFEGVEALLHALHRAGHRVALVSSARRGEEYLLARGIREYFEVIVGAHDVQKVKPDPEPVRLALDRLKLQADQVAMLGDSPADMEASRQAGVPYRVGITHGFGERTQLKTAGATHIIDALTDLPPLLKKLGTAV